MGQQDIAWPEFLATGWECIDHDHRTIIEEFNDLLRLAKCAHIRQDFEIALRHFIDHLKSHFKLEEGVLSKTSFPRLEDHVNEHLRIEHLLDQLASKLLAERPDEMPSLKLVLQLRDILIDLLIKCDLDYKSHLQFSLGR